MGDQQFDAQVRLLGGSEAPQSALLLLPQDLAIAPQDLPESIGGVQVVVATIGQAGISVGKPGKLLPVPPGSWHPAFAWRLLLNPNPGEQSMQTVVDLAGWLAPTLHVITPAADAEDAVREFRAALPVAEGSAFNIGRDRKACDLVLDDKHVSSEHLRIEVRGGRHYVTDLESKWGTKLAGEPLTGTRPLNHSDELIIGRTKLRFECIRDALAARDLSITNVEPMFAAEKPAAVPAPAPSPAAPQQPAPAPIPIPVPVPAIAPVQMFQQPLPEPEKSFSGRFVLALVCIAILVGGGILAWFLYNLVRG